MAEKVGTLLWELRTAGGWSLGRLAQAAGVNKSTLSQWEAGTRQPRVPELEAVMDALRATPAERVCVFSRIDAPRALRRLRQPAINPLGKPPTAADLLRAMRLRRGWTQEQVASRMGVRQHTVARWEQGERLPSMEQMQILCYALGAREEELVALTTGRFTGTPSEESTCWEEKEANLHERLLEIDNWLTLGLEDLCYLTLQREAWEWAAREEAAHSMLARIYASHATFCRNKERWSEVGPLAERALAMAPRQEVPQTFVLRAALMRAAALVYAGPRPAPERGLQELRRWLERSTLPEYTAWIWSDMAKYAVRLGNLETALTLAEQGVHAATDCVNPIEPILRQIDYGMVLLRAGRSAEALQLLNWDRGGLDINPTDVWLLRAEAYLALGHLSEAHDCLQRALPSIEKYDLAHMRSRANALAERF